MIYDTCEGRENKKRYFLRRNFSLKCEKKELNFTLSLMSFFT